MDEEQKKNTFVHKKIRTPGRKKTSGSLTLTGTLIIQVGGHQVKVLFKIELKFVID